MLKTPLATDDIPGDDPTVYDRFTAWVKRPPSADSDENEFFKLVHQDGYELIRHSAIRRVTVITIEE